MLYTSQDKLQKSAFGELVTTPITQLVQIENKYAIDPSELDVLETFEATGGSADTDGNLFRCQTGTSVGGYSVIRSKANIIYSAGQGVEARFTASFTAGQALSLQFGGMFSLTETLAFGFDGADFSAIHQYAGEAEVQLITVTATGAGTCTVTLDGTASSGITVTNSDVQTNVREIGDGLSSDALALAWRFECVDDRIYCIAKSTGNKTGTMSISGGVTANIVEKTTGEDQIKNNTSQDNWNRNTTPFVGFDPTKLNVYRIVFGYLGIANIDYSVYNPETGDWVLVHTVKWANTNGATHLRNPDLKIGWTSASLGSSGTNLTVTGASASMGIQGAESEIKLPFAAVGSTTGIGTTPTPVLSIKNRIVYGDRFNLGRLQLEISTVSNDHTKPLIVELIKNATLEGPTVWEFEDEYNSITLVDTTSTGYVGGSIIDAFTVAKDSSGLLDLAKVATFLLPEETLTVVVRTDSGTAVNTDATLTWLEKK